MVYDQGLLWLPLERVNRGSDRRCGHLLNLNRKCQIFDYLFWKRASGNRLWQGSEAIGTDLPLAYRKEKKKNSSEAAGFPPFSVGNNPARHPEVFWCSDTGPKPLRVEFPYVGWDRWRASGKAPGGSSRTHYCTHTHVGVGSCVTLSNL